MRESGMDRRGRSARPRSTCRPSVSYVVPESNPFAPGAASHEANTFARERRREKIPIECKRNRYINFLSMERQGENHAQCFKKRSAKLQCRRACVHERLVHLPPF
eukprot:scaffold324_cov326-Pavlova_lutheri.AAC.21